MLRLTLTNMSVTNGRSTVELYHPETDENYTIVVDWKYYFERGRYSMPNGDPGYPDEEELTWTATLTHIQGEPVAAETELPDWITVEMIEEHMDLSDVLEPDYD